MTTAAVPEQISDDRRAASDQRQWPWVIATLALLALVVGSLVLAEARTGLWYDESNYLVIASEIKRTGFPVWYWHPDWPGLFLDSPPGMLYLLSLFPDDVLRDPPLLRMLYVAPLLAAPIVALFVYLRTEALGWRLLFLTLAFLFTTGYFAIELLQIRFDLPLASLSFIALILLAEFERRPAGSGYAAKTLLLLAFAIVTALAFATKYQSACLTGAVAIWAMVRLASGRSLVMPVLAHVVGLTLALGAVYAVAWLYDGTGASVLNGLGYNLGRILSSPAQGSFDVVAFVRGAAVALAQMALPIGLYVLARLAAPDDARSDPLLSLSFWLSLAVVGFNIVTYRMPGAASYYMTQSAFPLAYLAARSVLLTAPPARRWVWVALLVGVINLVLTLPLGWTQNQYWNWVSFVRGASGPDQTRLISDEISRTLQPDEVILLDGEAQGREIPYWLGLSSRIGFITAMEPRHADELLQRSGAGRVAYIVFRWDDVLNKLKSPPWDGVWREVESLYEIVAVPDTSGWTVYRRKRGQ